MSTPKFWQQLTARQAQLILIIALVIELPVRWFLFPDPWIHEPTHWYFIQPLRLFIEIGLFATIFLVARLVGIPWSALGIRPLNQDEWTFLGIGAVVSGLVFGLMELEDLQTLLEVGLPVQTPLWFLTGLFIGLNQETGFRGLMLSSLLKLTHPIWAVAITTFLFVFGPLHGPRLWVYWQSGATEAVYLLIAIFAGAGLFFSWVRIHYDNLILTAVMHGIGNAITWTAVFPLILYT